MKKNPLLDLQAFRQSIWMDFISRGTIASGELQRLIESDGISGVTSNPSIFEEAIVKSHDYDASIEDLAQKGMSPAEIYQLLTVEDIQAVADLFRSTYDQTDGYDGFVSLEVAPGLAYDTSGTIDIARQLWLLVNRPNAMIKVPATAEGLPAIRQLIGEGININITLLFGLNRYREVADAYLSGLEILASSGRPIGQAVSVASFFLSRIDVQIDPLLEELRKTASPEADIAERIQGQAAIASAKVAYQIYKEIFSSDRFARLADKGARTQRLLWASTSTKNPAYKDTKYVEALIGPDTINTLPLKTINSYRDHGHPHLTLDKKIPEAYQVFAELSSIGIDIDAITQRLEDEGVIKFIKAFNQLLASLKEKVTVVHGH